MTYIPEPEWIAGYFLILLTLLIMEMYAVGRGKKYTLTHNLLSIVERVRWFGIIVLAFLIWLLLHFAFPIIRIWLATEGGNAVS